MNMPSINPYLSQAGQIQSGWSGDTLNAFNSQQNNDLMNLQNQQTQVLGNGGYGYTAGGGNDTGNPVYSQNPWAQSAGPGWGQGGDEGAPGYNPYQTASAYKVSGYSPVMTTQYENTQGIDPSQLSSWDPTVVGAAINLNNYQNQNGLNPYYGQTVTGAQSPAAASGLNQSGGGGAALNYPTTANQYGIGSQSAAAPSAPQSPALNPSNAPTPSASPSIASSPYQGQTQSFYQSQGNAAPLNSSTGFNPWSLTGEANSRVQ